MPKQCLVEEESPEISLCNSSVSKNTDVKKYGHFDGVVVGWWNLMTPIIESEILPHISKEDLDILDILVIWNSKLKSRHIHFFANMK